MRYQTQPAGPFDPRDLGVAFGPGAAALPWPDPSGFGRRGHRARRQAFRETMLAMSEQDEAGEGHPRDRHGRGRGRRGPGGPGFRGTGFGGPGFAGPGFGMGFAGMGFGGPHGRGPTAGRGDIRAGILALLAEQPRHGYEIIRELAERSDGAWRASPGSIYPTLKKLAHEGLVRADSGGGRRVFELTDTGRAYVAEHAEELAAPWDGLADDLDAGFVSLRDVIAQVAAAAIQVGQAGTAEQVSQAATLLTGTRRALYRILAEEPGSPAEQ